MCAVGLGGCEREDIRVYTVPKEALSDSAPVGHGIEQQVTPIRWVLPVGWEEVTPGRMQAARFSVRTADGQQAEAAIFNLPGAIGREGEVVNIWRAELGLEPRSGGRISDEVERVLVGEAVGNLYDLVGQRAQMGDKSAMRILVVTLTRPDGSWFFKLAGEQSAVEEGKPAFLEFLRSISFQEQAHSRTQAATSGKSASAGGRSDTSAVGRPSWDVPVNWREQPGSPVALASFQVSDEAGEKADITVTRLAGEGGGALANVNRWRWQIGLPPVSEAELGRIAKTLDIGGSKAMLVDLTGTDARTGRRARLIAASVVREGSTWFYKLIGDEKLVARERESFMKFLQTVRYSNG
jgi:hypothetical protein